MFNKLFYFIWLFLASLACQAETSLPSKRILAPYLLPDTHPMKPALDAIFHSQRPTLNGQTFRKAGFTTIYKKSRSFIHIASHPSVPGYLFKLYLDDERRQKLDKPGWQWLLQRCQGAAQIRRVIKAKQFKYFKVPQKWLYVLPPHESARHPLILLEDDMQLVSKEENLKAWYQGITKKHLREFYTIIRLARGSSYRPDNVWLNKKGKFCFIDTEYPRARPDFYSIRNYLNPKMCSYWDHLVAKGSK